ncbi:MAG: type II secretion system protein M [Methylibium sp.]|uniref:type II secretion system protein GspM n=1 Tax=Methylibium sp. TaxID=2067992 RepID=UPI00183BA631|nr:type II secretion system protein GspM [Methylibium sp.]MBA3599442.1 type II secretion system protein M [Methylibium sp.]
MSPSPIRPTLPSGLSAGLARGRAQWAGMALRERRLIVIALTLVAVAAVWLLAVQPAWRTLRETPAQIDVLDLQLQHMQRLAAESRVLRELPAVPPSQAEAALRGATERLGANARISLQGERATLTLSGVAGEALAAWLGEVRSAARARPDEAKLSRGPTGYSGTVVLSLPRGGN